MSSQSKLPPFLNSSASPLAAITEGISAFAQRSSEAFKNAQTTSAQSAPSAIADAAKSVAKNVRAAVGAQAGKLDLVTQEEFQVQRALLEKSMTKLAELSAKITALEAQLAQQSATNNALKTPEIRASSGIPPTALDA